MDQTLEPPLISWVPQAEITQYLLLCNKTAKIQKGKNRDLGNRIVFIDRPEYFAKTFSLLTRSKQRSSSVSTTVFLTKLGSFKAVSCYLSHRKIT